MKGHSLAAPDPTKLNAELFGQETSQRESEG